MNFCATRPAETPSQWEAEMVVTWAGQFYPNHLHIPCRADSFDLEDFYLLFHVPRQAGGTSTRLGTDGSFAMRASRRFFTEVVVVATRRILPLRQCLSLGLEPPPSLDLEVWVVGVIGFGGIQVDTNLLDYDMLSSITEATAPDRQLDSGLHWCFVPLHLRHLGAVGQ
ncbi:hypothetical protein Bbelb_162640 [Branchiostoma belcheri]|nr:hypothetical protein Bbelb_162640 [Branchiostoma belcheri]